MLLSDSQVQNEACLCLDVSGLYKKSGPQPYAVKSHFLKSSLKPLTVPHIGIWIQEIWSQAQAYVSPSQRLTVASNAKLGKGTVKLVTGYVQLYPGRGNQKDDLLNKVSGL